MSGSKKAALALVAFVLAACGGDSGGGADTLADEAADLFPSGTILDQAQTLADSIEAAAAGGRSAQARAGAFGLTQLTLDEYRGNRTSGGTSAGDGVATFIRHVFTAAGLAEPPVTAASLGTEGIVAIVRDTGGIYVSSNHHAGLQVPAGAVSLPALLVADRLPDQSAYAPTHGPLPTALAQYPLFYLFTLTPTVEFSSDAIIGLCQLSDEASAYYPPDDVFARLQLAHPDPNDHSIIQLLEKVNAPFLDCLSVNPGLRSAPTLMARAGGIGGRVRKFSPFGAVDPDTPAQADEAGIYVSNASDNSVRVFALDAAGNAAPVRVIKGAATGLSLPVGLDTDTQGNLYVANRSGAGVTVFPQVASGNVAPTRVLQATGLGAPQYLDVGPGGDVLVVTCPDCGTGGGGTTGIFHFALGASASDYSVAGANTGLTTPVGIGRDGTGNIFVANAFGGSVVVFAPGSSGNVAPIRSFSPGSGNAQSIAVGPNMVAVAVPGSGIQLYPLTASGAPSASAILGSPAVPLNYPGGMFIDGSTTPPVIYVADYGANAIHVIQTAGTAPNLTVASVRTIQGAATGLSGPLGVSVVRGAAGH